MTRTTQRDLARTLSTWEAKQLVSGEARHRAGDQIGAMRKYKKILDRNPRCWPALFSVATLAHHMCEHAWAVENLRRIVKALPGFVEAWFNIGTMLQCMGIYDEAEAALRTALELDPTFVSAWTNLGNAHLGLGRPDEASACFEKALFFAPRDSEARWNLAHVLILKGRWEEGWAAYEARWQIPGFVEMNAIAVDASRPDMPQPWRGAPLQGKTLVVCEEQGYGDTFMCLRYAPQLRAMGAKTVWAVRPEVMRLAQAAVAPDEVVSIREPVPGADYCVAMMTLHQRLGVTPETVPFPEGYLKCA